MENQYHRALISGAKWAMVATWYNRILGLVSTVILARLLTPEDFGIVAISSFFIFLFLAFTSVGTNRIVILEDEISEERLNSIWSLNLVLRIACAALLFISAPWIAGYTDESRVELVIQVVAIVPFLMAFRNIGLEVYEKQFNFKTTTIITIAAKTIGTLCSIAIAIIWQNYWAMIIAVIFSNVIELVMGYRICRYRPGWSTQYWRKQWHLSKWLYLTTISGYLRSRTDVMMLSHQLNSRTFGIYSFAQELAWLPFSDVIEPLNRGSFAVLSKLKNDHHAFCQSFYQQLAVLMLVVMPCAFGISVISAPFVNVVLGQQWLEAIPVMGHLAGLMVVMTLYMPLTVILTIKDKMHILFFADLLIVGVVALMLYWSAGSGIEHISFIRLMIGLCFLCVMVGIYVVVVGLNGARLLALLSLPLGCSLLMYGAVEWVMDLVVSDGQKLLVGMACGAVVYVASMVAGAFLFKGLVSEFQIIVSQLIRQVSMRLGIVRNAM